MEMKYTIDEQRHLFDVYTEAFKKFIHSLDRDQLVTVIDVLLKPEYVLGGFGLMGADTDEPNDELCEALIDGIEVYNSITFDEFAEILL